MYDVIIIGGGAAGMFAAAVLAQRDPKLRVLVLEKGPKTLAKVGISGGGRCNLTHVCPDVRSFASHYPRGGRELIGALHRFGPVETMAWFEGQGVPLVTLEDGCVFPRSDSSADVIRALQEAIRGSRTEIRTSCPVSGLRATGEGYEIAGESGVLVAGRSVLLATGGGSFVAGLNHTVEPCVPSLFTFNTADRAFTALSGIVVKAVRVRGPEGIDTEGELLITHGGVSGPAVLRLSSFGARVLAGLAYRFEMRINWLAGEREEQVCECLVVHKSMQPRQQLGTWSPLGLPVRLWGLLLERAGAASDREWGGCSTSVLRSIAREVTDFRLPISGKNRHRDEFVTCGGIRLKEVDFKTMESRLQRGLHFAGEVLDLDGLTGGYNLQAAWTTGYLAAEAMMNN